MKSISFFLLPKQDVTFLNESFTMRQAMEKMEYHSHTAVPTIDDEGKFIRILTEGDLLWKMKNTPELSFLETGKIPLRQIESRRESKAVDINATMEDLFELALNQNFVPVTDDSGIFIGIVTRKAIMSYFIDENHALSDQIKQMG